MTTIRPPKEIVSDLAGFVEIGPKMYLSVSSIKGIFPFHGKGMEALRKSFEDQGRLIDARGRNKFRSMILISTSAGWRLVISAVDICRLLARLAAWEMRKESTNGPPNLNAESLSALADDPSYADSVPAKHRRRGWRARGGPPGVFPYKPPRKEGTGVAPLEQAQGVRTEGGGTPKDPI